MSNIQEQAELEDCKPCRFATGIGFISSLCDELKSNNVDCGELVNQVKSGELKVNDFVSQIEGKINNANDYKDKDKALNLFHEIKQLMFKKSPLEVKEVKEVKEAKDSG